MNDSIPSGTRLSAVESLRNFDSLPDCAHVRLPTVCALFGVAPATVWRRVKSGQIPAPTKNGPKISAFQVGKLRAALAASGLKVGASETAAPKCDGLTDDDWKKIAANECPWCGGSFHFNVPSTGPGVFGFIGCNSCSLKAVVQMGVDYQGADALASAPVIPCDSVKSPGACGANRTAK